MYPSALVQCTTCHLPGRVMYDQTGRIVRYWFVCNCPKPKPEEINAMIKEANKEIGRGEPRP